MGCYANQLDLQCIVKLFGIILTTIILGQGEAFKVTLYEHVNYKGAKREIEIFRCHNLLNISFNDHASSIIIPECVVLYDDPCCQGMNTTLRNSTNNLDTNIDFNDRLTSISPCGDYFSPPPHQIHEDWPGHGQIMTKVAAGLDTLIYYNDEIERTALRSHSEFLRKAWDYVKRTYGYFGPERSRLFALFHANIPSSNHGCNYLQSYFDISADCRNLVDFAGMNKSSWSKPLAGTSELDEMAHGLAHIVEWSSKGIHGSPTFHVWGETWPEIFTYDLYKAIGFEQDKERWFDKMQVRKHDFPKKNTYWFSDWYFPIYQHYGGAQVLNDYFELLAKHFTKKDNGWEYGRDMNIGELVHFWSGAAKTNLKHHALEAFNWGEADEWALYQAKIAFPEVKYAN
ncbi:hypothetical protein Ocin01_16717 [Orchesella cincta]|uniref:Beta/gamma crystallin 'Greek key' domain-containing protein n=1 Tax=Orchesella cincta TaxID=48709 RepID=A0A1D2MAF4_ORCCI|nr:hypothetical protein Ocin01_16717 [Orchesella cincta]